MLAGGGAGCHVFSVRTARRRARNLRNATHDSRSTHDHFRRRKRSDGNKEVRPRHEAERADEEHAARAGDQQALRRKEEHREAQQLEEGRDEARRRQAQQHEECTEARRNALVEAQHREEEHHEARGGEEEHDEAW